MWKGRERGKQIPRILWIRAWGPKMWLEYKVVLTEKEPKPPKGTGCKQRPTLTEFPPGKELSKSKGEDEHTWCEPQPSGGRPAASQSAISSKDTRQFEVKQGTGAINLINRARASTKPNTKSVSKLQRRQHLAGMRN